LTDILILENVKFQEGSFKKWKKNAGSDTRENICEVWESGGG
jgi:hypothetical protein